MESCSHEKDTNYRHARNKEKVLSTSIAGMEMTLNCWQLLFHDRLGQYFRMTLVVFEALLGSVAPDLKCFSELFCLLFYCATSMEPSGTFLCEISQQTTWIWIYFSISNFVLGASRLIRTHFLWIFYLNIQTCWCFRVLNNSSVQDRTTPTPPSAWLSFCKKPKSYENRTTIPSHMFICTL